MLQHYINHISLIVDASTSMKGQPVETVFDKELENLKRRSVELDQETRISIYLFRDTVECLTFDMDVMRFKTLKGHYKADGNTALIDAVIKSTEDHKKLPELYGDHAFLQYVITDGEENASRIAGLFLPERVKKLKSTLTVLPSHWTTALLVPDARGRFNAKGLGFSDDSIAVWDTSANNAMEKVGSQFTQSIDNYMVMRSTGMRGTTGLFKLNTAAITPSALTEIPAAQFSILPVRKDGPIKEFVESWTKEPYRMGSTYYQPTKKVKIQDHKNILVQNTKNGRVYEGSNLRQLLGLPSQTVEVDPGVHRDWRIFVQSASVNRKLFKDTFALVRK